MAKLSAEALDERAKFFETFISRDDAYVDKIQHILSNGKDNYRLEVNLRDLEAKKSGISKMILNEPSGYLPPFEIGLQNYIQNNENFKEHTNEIAAVRLAIAGDFGGHHVTPRGLNRSLVNKLVCVEGVVTSTTQVKSRVTQAIYYCSDPSPELDQPQLVKRREIRDNTNLLWQKISLDTTSVKDDENGNHWDEEFGLTTYKDQQRITIQEAPENAPTGKIPTSIETIIEQDLVDAVKPGDRVRVVGVYRAFPKISNEMTNGIFPMRIICNSIKNIREDIMKVSLVFSEIKAIKEIARRPDFFDLLSRSFAPSIAGNQTVKKGLLLAMAGGAEKNFQNGAHLRGDINILLVGDPSCGKSQLLRFIMRMSPIAISTTGRGSSGVGLTAAIKVDQRTGERSLEAGAMVLGDGGTVMIDEFDKMNTSDRTAIHEVMEQQTVTIAKAGIHVTLNARATVIAAANPAFSSWDDSMSLHDNIALPDSLLSRFDLIFVMRDEIQKEKDRKISQQVLKQIMYKAPDNNRGPVDLTEIHDSVLQTNLTEDPVNKKKTNTAVFEEHHPSMSEADKQQLLTVDFLKKYLRFCKNREAMPQISKEAGEEIGTTYALLRQRMKEEASANGNLAVTTRTLEGLIRLSTAHAKLRLSDQVSKEDVQVASALLQESRYMEIQQVDAMPADVDEDEEYEEMLESKKRKKGGNAAKDKDDAEGADKKKKRKIVDDELLVNATFMRIKNALFEIFQTRKTMDIAVSQFQKHLNNKGIAHTEAELDDALDILVSKQKIMVEDGAIFLTA